MPGPVVHHEQVTGVKARVDGPGMCAFGMEEDGMGDGVRAVREERSDVLTCTFCFYPHSLPSSHSTGWATVVRPVGISRTIC